MKITPQMLAEALAQRDEALHELATARAELAALKLAQSRAGEPPPPAYPPSANPAEAPPLRYRLVDGLHERTKRWLGPLRRLVRGGR